MVLGQAYLAKSYLATPPPEEAHDRTRAARSDGFAPPIRLRTSDNDPPSEVSWLYFVRENREAVPLYVIFACGDIPYQANAHFDCANIACTGELINPYSEEAA